MLARPDLNAQLMAAYNDMFLSAYDIADVVPQSLNEFHQMTQTWTPLQWGLAVYQARFSTNMQIQVRLDLAMFAKYLREGGSEALASFVGDLITHPNLQFDQASMEQLFPAYQAFYLRRLETKTQSRPRLEEIVNPIAETAEQVEATMASITPTDWVVALNKYIWNSEDDSVIN